MIVKDEERHLPQCLESVRGQVDEIILVDTGSTDATPRVAARYGAKVFTYPWNNDFAAARNRSLEHATGDWVLYLDADEELVAFPQGVSLRQMAASLKVDAYLVPIQNMKMDGSFTGHFAIRFFKKLEGIRFEGKAHESVGDWLLRHGARVERAPVVIRHWGYAIPEDRLQEKIQRNLELLVAQVEKNPNDSYAHYYIGMSLIGMGDHERAYRHLVKAHELGPTTPNMQSLVLNMLAFYHLHRKEYIKAEDLARQSLAITPLQHTAKVFLGIALYNQQKFREALPFLREAYQFQRLPLESRRSDLSIEHSYGENELLWAVARSAYEVGNFPLAYQFARRLEKVATGDGPVLVLQALCALALGAFHEASAGFIKARSVGASWTWIGAPWMYALLQLEQLDEARSLLENAGLAFFENKDSAKIFALFVDRHWERGCLSELTETLTRLAQLDAVPVEVLDALALSLIKQQRYKDAVSALEKMRHRDPRRPEIIRRLAALYARLGEKTRAAHLLKSMDAARFTAPGPSLSVSKPFERWAAW